jgi:mono/diheme cytochrome c family protein
MRRVLAVALLSMIVRGPSGAETAASATGADAFARGCGGCHKSESAVLRRIPRGDDQGRRAWLQKFMALHPCECDDLKPAILDYLVERSRR